MPELKCGRRGCGKNFEESANEEGSCTYHPGGPVFHEGQKGWACCPKRVLTFEEFMALPGCTTGKHTVDTEPLPQFSDTSQIGKDDQKTEFSSSGSSIFAPSSSAAAAPAKASTQPASAALPKEEDVNDPADATVAAGAPCKRPWCKHTYGGADDKSECVFHSGEPVFHEGSKGWSCCNRKVLEFDEFLKIKGCKTGRHRYTEAITAATPAPKKVEVRIDWYQTQTHVIVSFFAKKVNKQASKIDFADEQMTVELVLEDGSVYQKNIPLSQPIAPDQCRANFLSVKVELTLAKANGIAWVSLEPPVGEVKSFTTFGTTGRVGTIGGKEIYAVRDAAILAPK